MSITKGVEVVLATEDDISRIISFLSNPEIDQAFVRPLSNRNTSIEERVRGGLSNGFWLIASYNSTVVGCRGCKGIVDQENKIAEFSTTAVASCYRGSGLGTLLLRTAVSIAFEQYSPLVMRFDSWSTNDAMEKVALKAGFRKGRVYEDPAKRPSGVMSVEYILDCSNMYLHG